MTHTKKKSHPVATRWPSDDHRIATGYLSGDFFKTIQNHPLVDAFSGAIRKGIQKPNW